MRAEIAPNVFLSGLNAGESEDAAQWRHEDVEKVQKEEELQHANICAHVIRTCETHTQTGLGGEQERGETGTSCANTLTLGRHVDSLVGDIVTQNVGERERENEEARLRGWKLVIRNALNS